MEVDLGLNITIAQTKRIICTNNGDKIDSEDNIDSKDNIDNVDQQLQNLKKSKKNETCNLIVKTDCEKGRYRTLDSGTHRLFTDFLMSKGFNRTKSVVIFT
jgi:hypothetical protein